MDKSFAWFHEFWFAFTAAWKYSHKLILSANIKAPSDNITLVTWVEKSIWPRWPYINVPFFWIVYIFTVEGLYDKPLHFSKISLTYSANIKSTLTILLLALEQKRQYTLAHCKKFQFSAFLSNFMNCYRRMCLLRHFSKKCSPIFLKTEEEWAINIWA